MTNNKLLPQYNVDGFEPNEACTRVVKTQPDGTKSESLFMKYAPAMAWFYTVFPNGCLNYVINQINNDRCTVTASVYRDANDNRPAAMATCTRYNNNSENGPYYEQNAVTAAFRKALGYLGFGTPIDAHPVDGQPVEVNTYIPEMSDGGVPVPLVPDELLQTTAPTAAPVSEPVTPVTEEQNQPAAEPVAAEPEAPKKRRGRKPKAKAEEPVMVEDPEPTPVVADVIAEEIPEEEPTVLMDAGTDMPEEIPAEQEIAPMADVTPESVPEPEDDTQAEISFEDLQNAAERASKAAAEFAAPAAPAPIDVPVEEEPVPAEVIDDAPHDITEAEKCVFPCGKYKGKSLDAAHNDGVDEYYRWFYDNVPGIKNDQKLKAALEIYMEFYGC